MAEINDKLKIAQASAQFLKVIIVLCACMVAGMIYFTILDGVYINKIVTYWPGSFVAHSPVHAGDDVWIQMNTTKTRDLVAQVHWSLVSNDNGRVYPFASRHGAVQPGYRSALVKAVQIPSDTPPGKYHLKGVAEYTLPFNAVQYSLRSTDFEVLPREQDGK